MRKKFLIRTFVYFRFSMIYWRVLSEWWLSVQYENRDWILALVQNRQKEETRKTALPFTRKRRSKKSTFNSIFHNTWWTLLNRKKNIFRIFIYYIIYRNNSFCTLTKDFVKIVIIFETHVVRIIFRETVNFVAHLKLNRFEFKITKIMHNLYHKTAYQLFSLQ